MKKSKSQQRGERSEDNCFIIISSTIIVNIMSILRTGA